MLALCLVLMMLVLAYLHAIDAIFIIFVVCGVDIKAILERVAGGFVFGRSQGPLSQTKTQRMRVFETPLRTRSARIISSAEPLPRNTTPVLFHLDTEVTGKTRPKTTEFKTAQRVRSTPSKSSAKVEEEMMASFPKFKARPVPPSSFKMSLNSESRHEPLRRTTTPVPFHLHTEERGVEKARKFIIMVDDEHREEERTRIPKANPYPFSTDVPIIPPKPEPKQCTRPEPFQLKSLARHEEEIRKETKERERQEREEARMRIFRAKPILKEDPIPVPEKVRRPLTKAQEFSLHVDHRAMERADFYERFMKAKEQGYKLYEEKMKAAKLVQRKERKSVIYPAINMR